MAKKMVVLALILLLAGVAAAQRSATPAGGLQQHAATEIIGAKKVVQGPTYADVYCAGYLASPVPTVLGYIAGGWDTPNQMQFGTNEYVYFKGSGFEAGKEYQVIRPSRDRNRVSQFRGQHGMVRSAGRHVAEIARVKVTDVRGDVTIARVEFSCDGVMAGDSVVPMPDRPMPLYHGPMPFDQFAPQNGKTTGRIILTRDYASSIGARSQVYLNIGADKGLKAGDWFRVTRDYAYPRNEQPNDAAAWGARDMVDDSQVDPKRISSGELHTLPRRSLGELVITQVEAKSATGIVTFALQEMFVGDSVEMIDVPPPAEEAAATMNPPAINCAASPASVRVGDNSTITCDASSPDNRPLTIAFASDRGSLAPRDNVATLSTANAGAGPITVNATATDDRNLSASTAVTVNVEAAPAAPQASLAGEAMFKKNSAYVDNRAKAMLDGIALRLNQERDAKAVIVGFADAGESNTLALRRANNVKTYLTRTKGIDAARIETRAGAGAGKKAEVWIVPAGATMP
ncbi:MAG TPA: OmpA family protein [Terriglobales bacterium]|nr:OmpA family protein [Terriglobales bacterium]